MPIGMPYYLEKGPTLRLMEGRLNTHSKSAREALRSKLCDEDISLGEWLMKDPLWENEAFKKRKDQGYDIPKGIAEHWFGEGWQQVGTENLPHPPTGYWIAYRGDVEKIVRRTLCWALQISLGCDEHGVDEDGKPVNDGGGRDDPWDIELFWSCPSNWFEGWVVARTIDDPGLEIDPDADRGLVTVIFMTPPHVGSVVAKSPLAAASKAWDPPNQIHPVPSNEPDYQRVWPLEPDPEEVADTTPRDRRYATWVVTHARHRAYDPQGAEIMTKDTRTTSRISATVLALGGVYSGYKPDGKVPEDVVIVSPSKNAGGILESGA